MLKRRQNLRGKNKAPHGSDALSLLLRFALMLQFAIVYDDIKSVA